MVLWYFRERDVFPEPPVLVARVFFLGAFGVFAAWGIVRVIGPFLPDPTNPWAIGLVSAFFRAAVPEDIPKYLILLWVFHRYVEFDEPMDGIVYGVAASMGFAAFENVFYVSEGGFETALMRAMTAVPSHGMHGVIMGYFLAMAWILPHRRVIHFAYALLIPMLFHGLYDFPLLVMEQLPEEGNTAYLPLATFAVLIVELAIALALNARVRALQMLGLETREVNHLRLLSFHRPGAISRRLRSWVVLCTGVLLVWGCLFLGVSSLAAVVSGGLPGIGLAALPLYASLIALGVRLFQRSVFRLNQVDLALGEIPPAPPTPRRES